MIQHYYWTHRHTAQSTAPPVFFLMGYPFLNLFWNRNDPVMQCLGHIQLLLGRYQLCVKSTDLGQRIILDNGQSLTSGYRFFYN